MDPIFIVSIILIGVVAGILGAIFGIGGGSIIIPILTFAYNIPMVDAAAISLISIVATSVGSTVYYIEKGVTNIRMGLFLEISTVIGSAIGAYLGLIMENWTIMVIFSIGLLLSALKMIVKPSRSAEKECYEGEFEYADLKNGKVYRYDMTHKKAGSALCIGAGIISSLTGVGGGVVKVPVMNAIMNVPMKAATATSSYMIGITAFSGAMIYLVNGMVLLDVAAFTVIGTFAGTILGSRLSRRFDASSLKKYFAILMLVIAVLMLLRAGGIL